MTSDAGCDIRKLLNDTAITAGLPIVSADKCCKLLAWLYVYGGGCESVVTDERLRNDILYAQRRLNILGGEVPDTELLPIFQEYVKSTGGYDKPYKTPPEWVIELEQEYGIRRR